jgi:homoserine/homoserine lactone efflux protein
MGRSICSAAAIGMAALLASSAVAFVTVGYLGAGYLVFLGIRSLRTDARPWRREHEL